MFASRFSFALVGLLTLGLAACGSMPAQQAPANQPGGSNTPPEPPGYQRIQFVSSYDGTPQDAVFVVPERDIAEPQKLVVYLHGWSVTHERREAALEAEAEKRGWLLIQPNFRGPYVNHCGNEAAQQDILDSVNWVKERYPVAGEHVYLMGLSGGGMMSMIMAHRYPEVWAAVSAWSGISDLAAWYNDEQSESRYGPQMLTCFGGSPSQVTDAYNERSPITHLSPETVLPPMDLNAQKDDSVVSPQHSMRAFQALAPGALSDVEREAVRVNEPYPEAAFLRIDPDTGREIYLRREAEKVRVTIREGGHEMLPAAAFEWFEQFERSQ